MRILQYIGRYQSFRGNFGGLPSWARLIIGLLALPGLVLLLLSFVALGVSILALLLLTVPAYRFFRAISGQPPLQQGEVISTQGEEVTVEPAPRLDPESPGRRHIDVKIVE